MSDDVSSVPDLAAMPGDEAPPLRFSPGLWPEGGGQCVRMGSLTLLLSTPPLPQAGRAAPPVPCGLRVVSG